MENAPSFRINLAHNAIGLPGEQVGPRVISDHEFVWIHSGGPLLVHAGERHELAPGDLVLLRPGIEHRLDWGATAVLHGALHFQPAAEEFAPLPPAASWPLRRRLAAEDALGHLIDHVMRLVHGRQAQCEHMVGSALRHVLACFVFAAPSDLARRELPLPAPLARLFARIDDYWSGGSLAVWTQEELAALAGVSAAHLRRLFRSSIGLSPVQCLRLLRLEWSAAVLLRSARPVQAIAAHCGFADPFTFSRNFRARFGVSPSAFRQGERRRRPLLVGVRTGEREQRPASALLHALLAAGGAGTAE